MVSCRRFRFSSAKPVTALVCASLAAILTIFACSDDPAKPKPPPRQVVKTYQDLSERDHVLENLELCYNEQNLSEYEKLLDLDFTFYFSEADYNAENPTPVQWNREDDLNSHQNMFDPNYTGRYKPISIQLSLDYTKGEASWVSTTPDQDLYPGETWYFKPVIYSLTLVAEATPENITFTGQDIKALFTVRQTELQGKQVWRIVEWRDDIDI